VFGIADKSKNDVKKLGFRQKPHDASLFRLNGQAINRSDVTLTRVPRAAESLEAPFGTGLIKPLRAGN
jgi:hypothetical protein